MLLNMARLSEIQTLSCFLAGLKHEIEMMVRMFYPKTLQKAYSLSKLQESVRNGPMETSTVNKGSYNKGVGGLVRSSMIRPNSLMSSSNSVLNHRDTSQGNRVKSPLNLTPK